MLCAALAQTAQAAGPGTASRIDASAYSGLVGQASPEQLAAAERVLVGQYDCEFRQRVSIGQHEGHPGYFKLHLGKQNWVMKPVVTPTGAVRLEDVRGAALLVQILTKSMVLDTRSGKRLVDACVHEVQRKAEADLAAQPARPSIFDSHR